MTGNDDPGVSDHELHPADPVERASDPEGSGDWVRLRFTDHDVIVLAA